MMDKILLAGFGGQGVMFIGKILAYAGMLDEQEICWIPSYGPEMRGGTANCSVIVSSAEIHSPVIEQADAGIVLNLLRRTGSNHRAIFQHVDMLANAHNKTHIMLN